MYISIYEQSYCFLEYVRTHRRCVATTMNSSVIDGNELSENFKTLLNGEEVQDQYSSIKKKLKQPKVLSVFDALFTAVFITPVVIFTWGSIWPLLDKHYSFLFPVYPSLWISTCILCGFSIVGAILDYFFGGCRQKGLCSKLLYKFVKFLYVYVFFVCNILQWRGLWALYATYITTRCQVCFVTLFCLVSLVLLKSLKNGVGCPFVIAVDLEEGFFDFPSRFRVGVSFYNT